MAAVCTFRVRTFDPATGKKTGEVTSDDADYIMALKEGHPESDSFVDIIWRGAVVFTESRRSTTYHGESEDFADTVIRIVPDIAR